MHGLHAFRVGDEVLEFPCRDVLEEHLIEFLEWAIRRLALVEEQVDPAQHGETAKDGLVRVEDVEQWLVRGQTASLFLTALDAVDVEPQNLLRALENRLQNITS